MAVVPPEDLSQEIYRLGRFVNCTEKSPVFIRKLARAGFYPTGVRDTVKCFSCGCEIGNLKDTDEILERHKQASPRCSYVSSVHCTSHEPKALAEPPIERVLRQTSLKRVFEPVSGIPTENTGMCREEARLKTFVSWPGQDKPTIEELATAGLYYVGTDDRTQCFVCRGILRSWDPSDCPLDEHRRCFPNCRFVRGLDVGNIPLVSGGAGRVQSGADDLHLGIHQPHSPDKQQFDVRFSTFVSWPNKANISASCLASAGFYYTGIADNVKCFFCDGGLRNWEMGDDPWHEHTKWFPRCGFVLQEKGQAYVRTVQSSYPNLMQVLSQANSAANTGRDQSTRHQATTCMEAEQSLADAQARTSKTNDYPSSTEEELRRLQDERMCKVCMDKEVSVVFIPCGHLVVCFDCASSPSLRKCPICRSVVRGTLRTYMS
uniref:baculoviral IAP repeat-containing protein 7-B-like isoform X2 n=1 Tax=Myxine glutinosa TaxID=7769 RepID=UPI00358F3FDC